MRALRRLWAGQVPPREAFWGWLVARGLVLNLACTLAALVLVATAADGATWQLWLAALVHLAAVPYNAICVAGIWRGTDREPAGGPDAAVLLRAAAGAVFVAYLVL